MRNPRSTAGNALQAGVNLIIEDLMRGIGLASATQKSFMV